MSLSTLTACSQTARTSASTSAYPSVGDHAIVSGTWADSTAPVHDGSGIGSACRSHGWGPITASSTSATSAVRLAMGPLVDSSGQLGGSGSPAGTRPNDGFIPDSPHSAEGIRID